MCVVRVGTPLLAIVIAVTVAACGASTAAPTTTTQPAVGRYFSQYPASFDSSFVSSCAEKAQESTCECFLHYLEAHVAYQRALTTIGVLIDGKKPFWFAPAAKLCLS